MKKLLAILLVLLITLSAVSALAGGKKLGPGMVAAARTAPTSLGAITLLKETQAWDSTPFTYTGAQVIAILKAGTSANPMQYLPNGWVRALVIIDGEEMAVWLDLN